MHIIVIINVFFKRIVQRIKKKETNPKLVSILINKIFEHK